MLSLFDLFIRHPDNGYGFAFLTWTPRDDEKPSKALIAITTKFIELYGINFEFLK